MPIRFLNLGLALVAVCVLGGIQRESFQGTLRTAQGEMLIQQDGKLLLSKQPPQRALPISRVFISAPYLQTENKKYLTLQDEGEGVQFSLQEKSDAAKWTFVDVSAIEPNRKGRLKEGSSGCRFLLQVPEGPHKNWYVGTEEVRESDLSPDKPAPFRRLILVEKKQDAVLLEYIEKDYRISHK